MQFKVKPFDHQKADFEKTVEKEVWAHFWEQGTGKTMIAINAAAHRFLNKEINGVLVVAPNGVHRNWETDEIPTHLPDQLIKQSRFLSFNTHKKDTLGHKHQANALLEHKGLSWLFISYDGFMTDAGKKYVWQFLKRRRCFYILDEASAIKTPKAKRTMSILSSAKYAPYRRILEGTPVANSPFDIYSQIKFLDENFWKAHFMDSYAAFKQQFGVWKKFTRKDNGREFETLVSYKNLDKLFEILQKISTRVLKDEVLDLPPKLYSKRYFDLSSQQRKTYDELKYENIAMLEQGMVVAPLAITMLLRLQQITSGYIPLLNPNQDEEAESEFHEFKDNPRLELLEELTKDPAHKQIVWAKYSRDIDKIMDVLGKGAVRYDGKITAEECERSKAEFKKGDAKWIVINPAKGGTGLTLNEAKTSIYYNNSYNVRHRWQSEDRCHRIGQEGGQHEQGEGVLYIDLIANDTIDEAIISSFLKKQEFAAKITGDKMKEWLR